MTNVTIVIKGENFTAQKEWKFEVLPKIGETLDLSEKDVLHGMRIENIAHTFVSVKRFLFFRRMRQEIYMYMSIHADLVLFVPRWGRYKSYWEPHSGKNYELGEQLNQENWILKPRNLEAVA